jgi:hypothetical protein
MVTGADMQTPRFTLSQGYCQEHTDSGRRQPTWEYRLWDSVTRDCITYIHCGEAYAALEAANRAEDARRAELKALLADIATVGV